MVLCAYISKIQNFHKIRTKWENCVRRKWKSISFIRHDNKKKSVDFIAYVFLRRLSFVWIKF